MRNPLFAKPFSVITMTLLACMFNASETQAQDLETKVSDPVRSQLTWLPLVQNINEDGDIDKFYLPYTLPGNKRGQLVCEMPWPVSEDAFSGGFTVEGDINFDGIPDAMVLLSFMDATGHNAICAGFVWDASEQQFAEVEGFTNIISPLVNEEEKNIVGNLRNDDLIECTQWEWQDGKLVITKQWQVDIDYDDNGKE